MVRGWGKSLFVSYLNALPTVVPAIGSDIAAVCVGRGEIKGRAQSGLEVPKLLAVAATTSTFFIRRAAARNAAIYCAHKELQAYASLPS